MHTYISLLRGINVSGQKSIKMDDLRKNYEQWGMENVRTYIQSGNVIFDTVRKDPGKLEQYLMDQLLEEYGFEVPVIIRKRSRMQEIIEHNPFLEDPGTDHKWLYITFLSEEPENGLNPNDSLHELSTDTEQFRISSREVYLYLPDGYGRTKLSNNTFERKLNVRATTRNWRTVKKLYELSNK